jgi:Asp/Glu/hydantoin racemase
MMRASGGRTNYGEAIGIIMLDTVFPRIPGDIGNASTFPFPVRYLTVEGASPQRVVKEADPALLQPFIAAAKQLERDGVKAIATSCGFLAIFQREIADAVDIPVYSSSLLQVPIAHAALSKNRVVGIMTARAQSLTARHLAGAGIQHIPTMIAGMEDAPAFTETFLGGNPYLDVAKVNAEMVGTAEKLVREHPEVGAIVLECTNMPPYARSVQAAVGLPVFDVVTMIKYAYATLAHKEFRGFM